MNLTGFQSASQAVAYSWAAVNISSSGDNTILTGVTGQKIRVFKVILSAASSVALTIKDASTAVFGPSTGTAWALDLENSPIILAAGDNLVFNLGGAVQVGGAVCYQVV